MTVDKGPGGFQWRDEQCPKRGAGLTHTQNGTLYCVHCGAMVGVRGTDTFEPDVTEPGFDRAKGPTGSSTGPGRGTMSYRQRLRYEFMAWLYARGNLD